MLSSLKCKKLSRLSCRLLRPLPAGLPVLWAAVHVLGAGGVSDLRRGRSQLLRRRGVLLLRGGGRGGGVPGGVGLRDAGKLLRVVWLPGGLLGVLRHRLPFVGRPIRGSLDDDVTAKDRNPWICLVGLNDPHPVWIWDQHKGSPTGT